MSTRHVPFEDVRRVLAACPPEWQKLFGVMLETGARYMEIATLMPEQVGIDSLKIEPHFLPDGTWWKPKRPASLRTVIIRQDLAEQLRSAEPGKLIFFPHKSYPTHAKTGNYFLQKTCKTLHIPTFTTHQLRRVRITQALEAGANPHTVRAAVGHRSLLTTVAYMNDIPVRAELPCLEAEPVPDPAVSQYLSMTRAKNWR